MTEPVEVMRFGVASIVVKEVPRRDSERKGVEYGEELY